MTVIAGMSARAASRKIKDMGEPEQRRLFRHSAIKAPRKPTGKPGHKKGGRSRLFRSVPFELFAVSKETQHEQEQVDEVEVERQRTHDRLAAGHFGTVCFVIHLLDLLGIVGGETCEDQD